MTTEFATASELDRLSSGDDFEVDLMACGCRLATPGPRQFSIYDVLRLYQFDEHQLAAFVGALIDAGKLNPEQIFEIADAAATGKHKEKDERRQLKY